MWWPIKPGCCLTCYKFQQISHWGTNPCVNEEPYSNYTNTTVLSVALVKFIYFIGSCDSSAPPAVCHPPSLISLPRAGASSTGCSIVIGRFGCPSSALYRGIGFLPELRPSWLYLSHCERLTALPAPPTAPAPPSSSKEGRRNCSSRMCHFEYAAKPCCYVTPWDYLARVAVGGKQG